MVDGVAFAAVVGGTVDVGVPSCAGRRAAMGDVVIVSVGGPAASPDVGGDVLGVVVLPAAVVLVAPAPVVEVAPAPVVVVVAFVGGLITPAGSCCCTGRKRSSAVRPMTASAWRRSVAPGRSTTMVLPCRLTSGSAMPRASTRLRMISAAVSSVDTSDPSTGNSTTETPPCRSRPSAGRFDDNNVPTNIPTTTTVVPINMIQ